MRPRITRVFAPAVVVMCIAAGTLNGCAHHSNTPVATSTPTINPTAPRRQVTLPITGGQHFYPQDVAVDAQGTVYAAAISEGVLKLAPGAQSAVSVKFTGLQVVTSVGVDGAGNLYAVDDDGSNKPGSVGRVQKRTPADVQSALPFTGLGHGLRLAVTPDGTAYVADRSHNRVLKLAPDATGPIELPFTGLKNPGYVAVDAAGNVYVSETVYPAESGNPRVLMLAAGSTNQSVLPITAEMQRAIAVDASGNVYLAGTQSVTVLAKGAQQPTRLPFTSSRGRTPDLVGMAVDAKGNIYLADNANEHFIELKI